MRHVSHAAHEAKPLPQPPRASNSRMRSSRRAVAASRWAESLAISSPSRSSSTMCAGVGTTLRVLRFIGASSMALRRPYTPLFGRLRRRQDARSATIPIVSTNPCPRASPRPHRPVVRDPRSIADAPQAPGLNVVKSGKLDTRAACYPRAHDRRADTPPRLPPGPGRQADAHRDHRESGGRDGRSRDGGPRRAVRALRRAAGARGVERQRGAGARRRCRHVLRRRRRGDPREPAGARPRRGPRDRERAAAHGGRVAGDPRAAAADAVRARARRGAGRAARRHDRAPVLRPAQLARDAAVHALAWLRSRRSARQDRRRVRRGSARPMNVAISLRLATEDWEQGSAYVVEAERLGAHSVWTPEAWGHDAVAPLAFLAARTSRILLGTAIMQAGTRTPALIALTALSLASMSHGRFRLGLGVSGPQVIQGWHGIRFDRPVLRLRETIDIVRRATRGERLEYKGEIYQLPLPGGEGKALRVGATPRPDIPIYLDTLSPRSLEMTGEVADGWLGTSFMPEHAHVFLDHLAVGAKRAGRSLDALDLHVSAGVVAFSDDVARLVPPRKPGLAFSLGAMGSRRHNFYNDAYRRAGYADVAAEVQRLWLDGRRDEATARVPDELVLKTNLLGTEAMVRERLVLYRRAGITTIRVEPAGETLDARLANPRRLLELARSLCEERHDGPEPLAPGNRVPRRG